MVDITAIFIKGMEEHKLVKGLVSQDTSTWDLIQLEIKGIIKIVHLAEVSVGTYKDTRLGTISLLMTV